MLLVTCCQFVRRRIWPLKLVEPNVSRPLGEGGLVLNGKRENVRIREKRNRRGSLGHISVGRFFQVEPHRRKQNGLGEAQTFALSPSRANNRLGEEFNRGDLGRMFFSMKD